MVWLMGKHNRRNNGLVYNSHHSNRKSSSKAKRLILNIRVLLLWLRINIKIALKEVWGCLWLFVVVVIVMGTPTWLGYLMYICFGFKWCMVVATSYLLFWNVIPCTPFIAICVAITLLIRKIFKR